MAPEGSATTPVTVAAGDGGGAAEVEANSEGAARRIRQKANRRIMQISRRTATIGPMEAADKRLTTDGNLFISATSVANGVSLAARNPGARATQSPPSPGPQT